MATELTPNLGLPYGALPGDPPVSRASWEQTVLAIDEGTAKWAFATDIVPATPSPGMLIASPDPYTTGARGSSVHTQGIWRGTEEVVRLTDHWADGDTDHTGALRRALISARVRKLPLYINMAAISINSTTVPIDYSGVSVFGLPGLTTVNDSSPAGATVFTASTAGGVSNSVRNLRFINAANRVSTFVLIKARDAFSVVADCLFEGMETLAGAVRVESATDTSAQGAPVNIERCYFRITTFGVYADAAAALSVGVLVDAVDARIAVVDCSFEDMDEGVRIVNTAPVHVIRSTFAHHGVYAEHLARNGDVDTSGIQQLSSGLLTVRECWFEGLGVPVRVASTTGTAFVDITGTKIQDCREVFTKSGGGDQYVAVLWVGCHGHLSLDRVAAHQSDTAEVLVVRCEGISGKFFAVTTRNCTAALAPTSAAQNGFVYSHDNTVPAGKSHSMFITYSAGAPASVVNV